MNDREACRALLDARFIAYAVVARLFADRPNSEIIDLITSTDFVEVCSALDDDEGVLKSYAVQLGNIAKKRGVSGCDEEYAQRFTAQCPQIYPWESVHVTGERLLFQPCMLEVRKAYREQGFQAFGYPHEPDDHVASELDFLSKMAKRALDTLDEGNDAICAEALNASKNFLEHHLNVWIADFARSFFVDCDEDGCASGNAAEGNRGASFYGTLALFVQRLVLSDIDLLAELQSILADSKKAESS